MLSVHRNASRNCFKTSKLLFLSTSSRNLSSSSNLVNLKLSSSSVSSQYRHISSKDVFGSPNLADVVAPTPTPPPPMPSLEELASQGHSVLDELGLISWWKPSSYFRMALEALHVHLDIPWWGAIAAGTVLLRLALIYVPVLSQKLVAKQSQFKPELDEFKTRMEDARAEGNMGLVQQVLVEQNKFMKERDIKMGRQLMVLLANGGVFMTQFFAIRKMCQVNYPGLNTGGALWFTDLTAADPYYLLPILSAVTLHAVMRVGIETGASADQMNPTMKLVMQYGIPAVVLVSSSQFASGLCVYWCVSNFMSLLYAGMFKTKAVRDFFRIPPVIKHPTKEQRASAWKLAWQQYKSRQGAAPSIASLRQKDAELFKKAGRAKPLK